MEHQAQPQRMGKYREEITGAVYFGVSVVTIAHACLNPLRTAAPFWGQTAWNSSGLSPKRDCGSNRVIITPSGGLPVERMAAVLPGVSVEPLFQ